MVYFYEYMAVFRGSLGKRIWQPNDRWEVIFGSRFLQGIVFPLVIIHIKDVPQKL